jgi:hypothetical protein
MAMKKEEARQAVLSEYDGWAKKHPRQRYVVFLTKAAPISSTVQRGGMRRRSPSFF